MQSRGLAAAIAITGLITAACGGAPRDAAEDTASKPESTAVAIKTPLPPAPEAGGWYSRVQADSGATLFAAHCQVCHGSKLEGGAGPALVGAQFFDRFGGQPVSKLWFGVHTEMPLTAPGTLPTNESLDIVSYILQKNGFPAGPYRLIGHYDVNRIVPSSSPGGPDVPGAALAAAPDTVVRQPTTSKPTQAELMAADTVSADWLMYGKGYRSARYSSLTAITPANAASLKPLCSVELGEGGALEAGPVVYDATIFVTTTHLTLAIDATTCAVKWKHQYVASDLEAAANNKGVAIGVGRVIRGTPDGHLIALDARTGTLLWNRKVMESKVGESAQSAPLIWNDMVYMAKAGGDLGVRGEVMAFHVADGSKVWGFFTIPLAPATGAGSWPAGAAEHGGGGNWTYFSIDPTTGTLIVPVGNPSPDFLGEPRAGGNLFTTGLVALDANTGALRWSYQTQPHDVHDWDATGSAVFTAKNGTGMVAATAKDGYIHLLDAASGKLHTKTAVTTRSNDTAPITSAGTRFCPGVMGGTEWNGAAYSEVSGLLYVNAIDWCVTVKLAPPPKPSAAISLSSFGGGVPKADSMSMAHGWTTALDPVTGRVKWKVKMPAPMVAAVTPTAGGVVFTGTLDGHFMALDAATGKTLYDHDTGGAIAGGIITYQVGGKQYVASTSGNTSYIAWRVTGKPSIVIFGL